MAVSIRRRLADRLSPSLRRTLRPVRWGNVKRRHPFSQNYGLERGLPVDRLYIERFLSSRSQLIRGDVLEVLRPEYTDRYGTEVVRRHVIDIDPTNAQATLVGDLCSRETLPDSAFDCVILTQTLQLLEDPPAAIANVWRTLRAGGSLLITVPCASRIAHEYPEQDLWRWTPQGLRRLLEAQSAGGLIELQAGGNLVACVAFFLGIAVEDLNMQDLAVDDPMFPLVACAQATKLAR